MPTMLFSFLQKFASTVALTGENQGGADAPFWVSSLVLFVCVFVSCQHFVLSLSGKSFWESENEGWIPCSEIVQTAASVCFPWLRLPLSLSWHSLEQAWLCSLSGKQKHRTFSMKTSVVLGQNIRTFAQRSPMFCTFRTATLLSLNKKSFWKSPTFPTPQHEMPCIYWRFRVKDRV